MKGQIRAIDAGGYESALTGAKESIEHVQYQAPVLGNRGRT
jgi:hypothetical protein